MDSFFGVLQVVFVIAGTVLCALRYAQDVFGGGVLGAVIGLTTGGLSAALGNSYEGAWLGAVFAGIFLVYQWAEIKNYPFNFGSRSSSDKNRGDWGDGGDGGGGS
jgi:hypothetical protein